MTLLVTGAAGFIGSHLLERLLPSGESPPAGSEATGISAIVQSAWTDVLGVDNLCDHYSSTLKLKNLAAWRGRPGGTFAPVDILDTRLLHKTCKEHQVRAIVHLAAHAGVRQSFEMAEAYCRVNVQGTLSVLEVARELKVDRLVFVSSSTVYGDECPVPFAEDAPWGVSRSPYGATKQAGECLVRTYGLSHQVPWVILRPFSVYGPRLRPDLALMVFAKALLAGRPIPLLGDGSMRRDFTHVDDVCTGIFSALERPQALGQAFNLGHHEPVAVLTAVETLAAALGVTPTIQHQPPHAGDLPITCADLSKAQRLLNYHPEISFADGCRRFAEWYLKDAGQCAL